MNACSSVLTDFESSAMELILAAQAPHIPMNLLSVTVTSREHTGVGCFVHMKCQGISSLFQTTRCFTPISADVEGMLYGVVAILCPEQNDVMWLEVCSNAQEEFPQVVGSFKFHNMS